MEIGLARRVVNASSGEPAVLGRPCDVQHIVGVPLQRHDVLPVLHVGHVAAAKGPPARTRPQLVDAHELVVRPCARGAEPAPLTSCALQRHTNQSLSLPEQILQLC